jgi:hypothetical protein
MLQYSLVLLLFVLVRSRLPCQYPTWLLLRNVQKIRIGNHMITVVVLFDLYPQQRIEWHHNRTTNDNKHWATKFSLSLVPTPPLPRVSGSKE